VHFSGARDVKAPKERVFQYVLDPNKVAACAPGFKTMEILAGDHFKPTLAVGIGAIKATFTLDVTLEDVRPTDHAAMRAKGAAAGSAVEIRAAMDLTPVSDDVSHVDWTADVNVAGTIASVGARMMEGVAHKQIDQFFECFCAKIEAGT
jgi:uncharacterized protein